MVEVAGQLEQPVGKPFDHAKIQDKIRGAHPLGVNGPDQAAVGYAFPDKGDERLSAVSKKAHLLLFFVPAHPVGQSLVEQAAKPPGHTVQPQVLGRGKVGRPIPHICQPPVGAQPAALIAVSPVGVLAHQQKAADGGNADGQQNPGAEAGQNPPIGHNANAVLQKGGHGFHHYPGRACVRAAVF